MKLSSKMRVSNFKTALLVAGGLVLATGQNALANNSITGGGQILNPGNGYKISFSIPAIAGDFPLEGAVQIIFHSTSNPEFDKAKFHGNVSYFYRYPDCSQPTNSEIPVVKVVEVDATGTLNGELGYTVVLYASDSGPHGQWDTDPTSLNGADAVNIVVYYSSDPNNPKANLVYTTGGTPTADFPGNSTACPFMDSNHRTYLDHGNFTINP